MTDTHPTHPHAIKTVSFFGCACGAPGDPNYDFAKATAKLVAQSGRSVANGGGPGIMLATTLGAKEAKGHTVAVYYTPSYATHFEGKTALNFADEHFEESNYVLRTKKLLEIGDIYMIFNGGTGTLSEFAMAWGVARLYSGHHKPLILCGDFWHQIMDGFKKSMLVRRDEYTVFTIVSTPEEAIEAMEKYEEILRHNRHEHAKADNAERYLLL